MTMLSELARTAGEIADDSGNDWEAMTEGELVTMMQGLSVACTGCAEFLVQRLRNDIERARVEITRAMDLPPRVLHRRAKEAEAIITRDDVPNIPQHAAYVAIMLRDIQAIGARLDRKQSGAVLN